MHTKDEGGMKEEGIKIGKKKRDPIYICRSLATDSAE
jgi:hypothetical protein